MRLIPRDSSPSGQTKPGLWWQCHSKYVRDTGEQQGMCRVVNLLPLTFIARRLSQTFIPASHLLPLTRANGYPELSDQIGGKKKKSLNLAAALHFLRFLNIMQRTTAGRNVLLLVCYDESEPDRPDGKFPKSVGFNLLVHLGNKT